MIKIGLVNLDTSHPKSFSAYLNSGNRARYAAVFNDGFRGDDEVEGFMKMAGVEKRCSTIRELAGCVDIGFIQGCNWDKHPEQIQPFLDAGKPVYIDKPMVGNLADCKKLEKLAQKGAKILAGASVRYAEEITVFLRKPESERGKILTIFGTSGVDEFFYAINIVEAIHELSKSRPASAKFVGRTHVEGGLCETFFVTFENGVTAMYNSCIGPWHPLHLVIMTTKGTYPISFDSKKFPQPLLNHICDYMETGTCDLSSVQEVTDSVKIMLAARISRQKGGKEVKLMDIPESDPGFDGDLLEKEYASRSSKLYV